MQSQGSDVSQFSSVERDAKQQEPRTQHSNCARFWSQSVEWRIHCTCRSGSLRSSDSEQTINVCHAAREVERDRVSCRRSIAQGREVLEGRTVRAISSGAVAKGKIVEGEG